MGIIFQSYNLLFKLTAFENVMMGLYLSGKKQPIPSEALLLLENVGIEGATVKRTILNLSGGEQQRVAIARALTGSPDIIIADEPTGNLDCENSEIIINILKGESKKKNKCVIVVTHNEKVAGCADVVLNIRDGK